jgi:hypothetical protein
MHTSLYCRYKVTADLGQGHLVLGKLSSSADLTMEEIASVKQLLQEANLKKGTLYHRVMINGIVYTSTNYHQFTKAMNDHIFTIVEGNVKFVASAQKYVSVCKVDCVNCSSPCQHIMIVKVLPILEYQIITETITGTTTQHHHRICQDSRY